MFELFKTSLRSKARLGRLTTKRGKIDTPVFMPVGTQASVKALDLRELNEIGSEILLGNTYHLFLRPGMDIIRKAGGLHTFMNWDKPILTDSGGFQVYSLAKIRSVRDDGVEFRSHLSGETLFLGPRESMSIQRELGSDIAMLFDECPPHGCSESELEAAVKRTLDWAAICAEQPRADGQFYFGIVQGANSPELRRSCAEELVAMDFDGYAVGGVSVGEPEPEMMHAVEISEPYLPENKARYAMGLGTPAQLVELVARGIDMFDCVLPTRVARNGTAYTSGGAINLRAGHQKENFGPIEEGCECFACTHHTRAYLRHLLKAGEILGLRMLSVHNSHFYHEVMRQIRRHLAEGTFDDYREEFIARYKPTSKVLEGRANSKHKAL
jgi:queuine tRNA-ribosyltransferase